MGKRGVGALLCFKAGILFSARYLAAAIFMSNAQAWSNEFFKAGLGYVGAPLLTLGVLNLLAGIGYLIWAEVSDRDNKKSGKQE